MGGGDEEHDEHEGQIEDTNTCTHAVPVALVGPNHPPNRITKGKDTKVEFPSERLASK